MYDLLKVIIDDLGVTNDNYKDLYFTSNDLSGKVPISIDSVSKSLQRLVKRGYVVRVFYRTPERLGRHCKYRVKDDSVISFFNTYFGGDKE